MNFIFCKLKKPQKTWISFFASWKNLKKHAFHFFFKLNPRMWNPTSSRVFWKRHHEMDSSWGTIKNRFRTKITFLSQIFQERTLARVPISLTDRYWEFWQILFFLLKPGEILFLFFFHISRISREIKLFFDAKSQFKITKSFQKKSFHLTAQICDDGLCINI